MVPGRRTFGCRWAGAVALAGWIFAVSTMEAQDAVEATGVSTAPPAAEGTGEKELSELAQMLPRGPLTVICRADGEVRKLADGLLDRITAENRYPDGSAFLPLMVMSSSGPLLLSAGPEELAVATVGDSGERARLEAAAAAREIEVTWTSLDDEGGAKVWGGEVRPTTNSLRRAVYRRMTPLFLLGRDSDGLLMAVTERETWLTLAEKVSGKPLFESASLGAKTPLGLGGELPATTDEPLQFVLDLDALLGEPGRPPRQPIAGLTGPNNSPWKSIMGGARLRGDALDAQFQMAARDGSDPVAEILGEGGAHPHWGEVPGDCFLIVSARTQSMEKAFDAWLKVLADGDAGAMAAAEKDADAFFGFPLRESLLKRLGPACTIGFRHTRENLVETWFVADATECESLDGVFHTASDRFKYLRRWESFGGSRIWIAESGEQPWRIAWQSESNRLVLVWSRGPLESLENRMQAGEGKSAREPEEFKAAREHAAVCAYVNVTKAREVLREGAPARPGASTDGGGEFPVWVALNGSKAGLAGNLWLRENMVDLLWDVLPGFSMASKK